MSLDLTTRAVLAGLVYGLTPGVNLGSCSPAKLSTMDLKKASHDTGDALMAAQEDLTVQNRLTASTLPAKPRVEVSHPGDELRNLVDGPYRYLSLNEWLPVFG